MVEAQVKRRWAWVWGENPCCWGGLSSAWRGWKRELVTGCPGGGVCWGEGRAAGERLRVTYIGMSTEVEGGEERPWEEPRAAQSPAVTGGR